MRIATGEESETLTDEGKNAAVVALGRMGGKARAAALGKRTSKEMALPKPGKRGPYKKAT